MKKASTLLLILSASASAQTSDLVARAQEIHRRVITIDTHDDIPLDFATPKVDPGVRGRRQVDIPKMIEGGLGVGFFIVFAPQGPRTEQGYASMKEQALTKFRAIHRMTREMHPDKIDLAASPDEVQRIARSGKRVACIGIENGGVIGKDLSLLKAYHELGARYITLAHNGHNDICDSANPSARLGDAPAEHDGVSAFGRQVIAEMNRLGIMVDVSHISKKSMLDALKLSRAPVIASHSSVRALAETPRNMDDEQLLALKEKGGVIQICALSSFVKVDSPERREAIARLRKELGLPEFGAGGGPPANASEAEQKVFEKKSDLFEEKMKTLNGQPPPLGRANVADFVNHVDYAVKLIGIDHVGISSDFDGGGGIEGWADASETFNVTFELVKRGYTEEQIAQIWGGNLLRVWREVEKVAVRLRQASP